MNRLRVLITNTALIGHSGTECHVRDLARSLLRHGHAPVVYSTFLGAMARASVSGAKNVPDSCKSRPASLWGYRRQ